MKPYIAIVLFAFFSFQGVLSFSQSKEDTVYKERVTVIAKYNPTISDAFKININPSISDTAVVVPKFSYNVLDKMAITKYNVEQIKPARVGDATVTKLYKALLKAGFGNYTTPYGEAFFNTVHSKKYNAGFHYKHLSSTGKLKNYGYSDYSNNEANLFGKMIMKTHTLSANFDYNRNVVHYYGYQPTDILPKLDKMDTKQRFSYFNGSFLLNSHYSPDSSKWNHSVGVGFYNLSDLYNTVENCLTVNADVNKELGLIKITKSQILGVKADVEYYLSQNKTSSFNTGLISIAPYLNTTFKKFFFNIGVKADIAIDSSTSLHFYPIADVQFNVIKTILMIYGSIEGSMTHNSYKSFSDENPFVNSMISQEFSNNKFTVKGGLKSNISQNISANAMVKYSRIKNMPFYVTDTTDLYRNKFNAVYDDVNLFVVHAEVAYQKNEKLRILFGGNFYQYTMDKEEKAWQKPYFDIFLTAKYNIADKFIITADIISNSNYYAKTYNSATVVPLSVKGFVDASLGFEYRYSKLLSAFININNIASTKYQRWLNYPVQGFNLLGGLTFSF
jgi:hypothetical protein